MTERMLGELICAYTSSRPGRPRRKRRGAFEHARPERSAEFVRAGGPRLLLTGEERVGLAQGRGELGTGQIS